MHLRTTTVLNLSALAVLALTGCSTGSADPIAPAPSTTVSVRPDNESAPASAPLSSAHWPSDFSTRTTWTRVTPARRSVPHSTTT